MTIRNLLAGTIIAAAAMCGSSALAQDKQVEIRFSHWVPPTHPLQAAITEWGESVKAASNGTISVTIFPAQQLGAAKDTYDMVRDGIADMGYINPGYTPGRFPQSEVFELPFAMTNAEDTSRAFWQYAEANMMDKDFKDYKIIAVHVHGPGLIHSKEPIRSVKDLNGVKLRAPTRITNKLFSQLGATPVGMPVPAVPEALSKGVIDATVIPWEVTGALKVPELVHNHTEFGDASLYTTAFMFAMNKQVYEGLSDELKAAIDANSGEETSAWFGKLMQEADAPSRELAVSLGNNIMTLSDAEVQEWKDASAGIEAEWIADMNGLGFDGKALVDQAKGLIEKAGM